MKRISSSYSVRVLGMALGVVLVASSTSRAFFGLPIPIPLPDFSFPGLLGSSSSVRMILPEVKNNGDLKQVNKIKSDTQKIFYNCILHTAVASGSGFTNNKPNGNNNVAVSESNHQTVDSASKKSIKKYIKQVCGSKPKITSSQYNVGEDATPGNDNDRQAFASVKCTAAI